MEIALKSTVAAALAWALAEAAIRAFGAYELGEYLYYAPFGAVFATDVTVAGTWRIARQSAVALLLGALLGVAVDRTFDPGLLSLALVVAAGVLLGSLPGLGAQRSWVPIAALFVLVIGHGRETEEYATAYVVLTALGTACGVLVNLLFPSMPYRQEREAMQLLKSQLGGQLLDLADGLRQDPPPGPEGWASRHRDTQGSLDLTRESVRQLLEAQRGNLIEAGRHEAAARRQADILAALERVAFLVEDLLIVLAHSHRQDLPHSPIDRALAGIVADALEGLAELVLVFDEELASDDPRVRDVERSMHTLTDEFGRRRDLDARDVALLGGVVANLRRASETIHPAMVNPEH